MSEHKPRFELRIASTEEDIRAAQHLRYQVFVQELGGSGPDVDHDAQLERDSFDAAFDHLILYDRTRDGAQAIGAYRVMRDDQAAELGRFYSDDEFDLGPLRRSGRKLLELGRSCVHPDYRGGSALAHLWVGLMNYADAHKIEVMFGVASFHGIDPNAFAPALSYLHYDCLAPIELRPRVVDAHYHSAAILPPEAVDRKEAMAQMPALIKAYLRLGGTIGDGVFIDRPFNTCDVCIVVDIPKVPPKQRAMYERLAARDGAA